MFSPRTNFTMAFWEGQIGHSNGTPSKRWPGGSTAYRETAFGLGQPTLNTLSQRAQAVQAEHQRLLDQYNASGPSAEVALRIENELAGLRQEWWRENSPLVGVQFPNQLNRSIPTHAIVAAIWDDIIDSENRIRLARSSRRLSMLIKELVELPPLGIGLPGDKIPWGWIGLGLGAGFIFALIARGD